MWVAYGVLAYNLSQILNMILKGVYNSKSIATSFLLLCYLPDPFLGGDFLFKDYYLHSNVPSNMTFLDNLIRVHHTIRQYIVNWGKIIENI